MTNPPVRIPSDQPERDRITTALDETLFVEAGAGTGKTTALVDRIVSLVRAGVGIGALAAITFTEAAAAELRERVRQRLELAAAQGGHEASRYADALAALDAAAIQTLHGFARRILGLFPLEAGLPPGFEVRDAVQADTDFSVRWADFCRDLYSQGNEGSRLPRALALGLKDSHLRGLATSLWANWDRLDYPAGRPQPLPAIDVGPILAHIDAATALETECSNPEDNLLAVVHRARAVGEQLAVFAAALADAADPVARTLAEQDLLRYLAAFTGFGNTSYGNAKAWHGSKQEVVSALNTAKTAILECVAALRRDCVQALLPGLVAWTLDAAEARRLGGVLEYHDLLVSTVRLLRGQPSVREALHARFTHLLIDEFQDTDPLQIELAALLATTATEVGDARWQSLPIPPGSLFFVGDPRQSIYRFRRADIEVYAEAREVFGAEPVHLSANFRSRPGVIDWVNRYFSDLFARPYGVSPDLPLQPGYVPLASYREAEAPVVHVIGGPSPDNIGTIRTAEAAEIAKMIRTAREHDWLGKAETGGGTRFADVAILIPQRTALPKLEQALTDAGIPFRIEGATLLFDSQDVRDLTNILTAIDDPADEVAVVAALRSPGFACADDELYAFRRGRPYRTWDYLARMPDDIPDTNVVRQGLEALRAFHAARTWQSTGELVETVIRDRHLFEIAYAQARPRDTWQRLRFLHEQARRFDADAALTLHDFVEWLKGRAASGLRLSESVVPDPDDDAVRIMTIHAAKGLEFPIVFVAGLMREREKKHSPLLFARDAGRGPAHPEVSVGPKEACFATEGYSDLYAREQVMERLEDDRLLYVATTRARDCLVVSAYHKSKNSEHAVRHQKAGCTLAECLDDACSRVPALRGVAPELADLAPSQPATPVGEQPGREGRAEWLQQRQTLLVEQRREPIIAATAIAHSADESEKPEPLDDDHSPWRRGRAGTAVGRAVHAVLQTIDHTTLEGLESIARAQSAAEGVPERTDEIAQLVRVACASAPVRAAAAADASWREIYVSTPIATPAGEIIVEGFIDLLYRTPEGYVVVDYKTDGIGSDAQLDRAMVNYRLQGAAYALALEQHLGVPVVRFECVFVTPDRVRTVAGPDLRDAMDEVRRRMATLRGPAQGDAAQAAAPA